MILLDTSLIVAYSNEVDENHLIATEIMERIDGEEFGRGIITDYIFDEIVTVTMARGGSVKRARRLGDLLLESLYLIKVDETQFMDAWDMFGRQTTHMSFTDCTTIAVCRLNGIPNIGTLDREFLSIGDLNIVGL